MRNNDKSCLLCDKPTRLRGLCAMHYQRYRRQWLAFAPERRDDFDEFLIQSGRLMPPEKGNSAPDNEFAEAAKEFASLYVAKGYRKPSRGSSSRTESQHRIADSGQSHKPSVHSKRPKEAKQRAKKLVEPDYPPEEGSLDEQETKSSDRVRKFPKEKGI